MIIDFATPTIGFITQASSLIAMGGQDRANPVAVAPAEATAHPQQTLTVLANLKPDGDSINTASLIGRQSTPTVTTLPIRKNHTSVVFDDGLDDKIWALGGSSSSNSVTNDIYSSTDGVSWTQVTTNADWSARAFHKSFVYDNKIWVVGAYDEVGNQQDIWSLANGSSTWVEEATPTFLARQGFDVFNLRDELWLNRGIGSLVRTPLLSTQATGIKTPVLAPLLYKVYQ